jgi:cell division protein FtsB
VKVLKYLFALWAGVLIYTMLSLSVGARGLSAYAQLTEERAKQEAGIESLRRINRELENSMNSLVHDEDTVSVYARELGLARAEERFIRIVGLGGYQQTRTAAGEVVPISAPQFMSNRSIQLIALFSGLTVLICMIAFDFMKALKEV